MNVTKRQIYTIAEDDINTKELEVSIIQNNDEDSGATIDFGNGLKIDYQDLLDLANLVKFLTKD